MKHKTFPLFIMTLVFVAASSCGDDGADKGKDLEMAALRAKMAQQGTATVTLSSTATTTVTNNTTTTVTRVQTSNTTNTSTTTTDTGTTRE